MTDCRDYPRNFRGTDAKAYGLKFPTFRNLHRLRRRKIFLRLSLCGEKRDTFYRNKREWLKIPDVQKFTQTQAMGIFICLSMRKNGTHFTDPTREWLKIPNVQKFTQLFRQRGIFHLSVGGLDGIFF